MRLGGVVLSAAVLTSGLAAPEPAVGLAAPIMAADAYGTHPRQKLDVHRPRGKKKGTRPGVILVHGGYWSGGDKRGLTKLAKSLARNGWIAVNINYRLSTDALWPAQRDDAMLAMGWARSNARRLGLDATRLVMIGVSAGGHIATAVGTYRSAGASLRGVVGLSPVASPVTAYRDGSAASASPLSVKLRDSAVAVAGCPPEACPLQWADLEAMSQASPADAPMYLLHAKDEFVPPSHSRQLALALARHRVPVRIRVLPGHHHGQALLADRSVRRSVVRWITARLARDSE